MKRLILFFALAAILAAQDVTDVASLAKVAGTTNTIVQTITGTDGTVCKLAKIAGASISAVFACGNGGNVMRTVQIQSTGPGTSAQIHGQDAVLCIIALNPTKSPVGFGSVGTAPPNSMNWSCTGDATTIQNGTVSWP